VCYQCPAPSFARWWWSGFHSVDPDRSPGLPGVRGTPLASRPSRHSTTKDTRTPRCCWRVWVSCGVSRSRADLCATEAHACRSLNRSPRRHGACSASTRLRAPPPQPRPSPHAAPVHLQPIGRRERAVRTHSPTQAKPKRESRLTELPQVTLYQRRASRTKNWAWLRKMMIIIAKDFRGVDKMRRPDAFWSRSSARLTKRRSTSSQIKSTK